MRQDPRNGFGADILGRNTYSPQQVDWHLDPRKEPTRCTGWRCLSTANVSGIAPAYLSAQLGIVSTKRVLRST